MDRKKLATAVAEAERFLERVKSLPKPEKYEVPGSKYNPFTRDNYPKQQGAIRRASMDLTRALAELRRPS